MDKKVLALVAILLVLLVACESKTVGKRVAVPETSSNGATGSVASAPAVAAPTAETKKAAEALKDIKSGSGITGAVVTNSTPKSGTFYPPVTTSATGKDALKAKTEALMNQSGYVPTVKADTTFGPRYHTGSGSSTNLPSGYTDN